MMKQMVMEFIIFQDKDVNMKGIGIIIIKMELEKKDGGIAIIMKENLKMGKKMVLEFITGMMAHFIRESGLIIISMVGEYLIVKIKEYI